MEVHLKLGDELNLVAVYAAIVSTLVLIWQIYTYVRSGPRLRLRINAGMKTFGGSVEDDNSYIVYNVSNVGNGDTTITHITLHVYKNQWRWLRKRDMKAAVVTQSVGAYPVPYVLKPGQTFMAMARQDKELEQWSQDYRLYGAITHSVGKRPVYKRIKPKSSVR